MRSPGRPHSSTTGVLIRGGQDTHAPRHDPVGTRGGTVSARQGERPLKEAGIPDVRLQAVTGAGLWHRPPHSEQLPKLPLLPSTDPLASAPPTQRVPVHLTLSPRGGRPGLLEALVSPAQNPKSTPRPPAGAPDPHRRSSAGVSMRPSDPALPPPPPSPPTPNLPCPHPPASVPTHSQLALPPIPLRPRPQSPVGARR